MSSLGSPNSFFIAGKKAYEVERSLRFNSGDSAYLQNTPSSAGNRKTNTLSAWVKRGSASISCIASCYSGNSDANNMSVLIRDDGEIRIVGYYNNFRITNKLLRDHSAWYHYVFVLDTTNSTSSERVRLYINGLRETTFSTETYPSQNHDTYVNTTNEHQIGAYNGGSGYMMDGYLSLIHI